MKVIQIEGYGAGYLSVCVRIITKYQVEANASHTAHTHTHRDIEIKEAIWGKQTYASKKDSAERKSSRKECGYECLGSKFAPSRKFEEIRKSQVSALSKLPQQVQASLRIGVLCHHAVRRWELPTLAPATPKDVLLSQALRKPRKLSHHVF